MSSAHNPYAAPQSEREANAAVRQRVYRCAIRAGLTAFVAGFVLSAGACAVGWYILTNNYGKPSFGIEWSVRLALLGVCILFGLACGVASGRGVLREQAEEAAAEQTVPQNGDRFHEH